MTCYALLQRFATPAGARGTRSRRTNRSGLICWRRRTRRLKPWKVADRSNFRRNSETCLRTWRFHIDIAARAGEFDAADVVSGVIDKLVRRHPHVFGDGESMQDASEVVEQWEDLKRRERGRRSIVESLPVSMPALSYASAVLGRAEKGGRAD